MLSNKIWLLKFKNKLKMSFILSLFNRPNNLNMSLLTNTLFAKVTKYLLFSGSYENVEFLKQYIPRN